MTTDPTGHHHDWQSAAYVDHWIATDATRDEERKGVLRRVAQLIPHDFQASIRVLDVGAGYGALTQQVLDLFPHAEVVLHDYSEAMFAHARRRLAAETRRLSYVISDLHDPSWTQALPGPFEAVVSAIAIHNIGYPERIRAIYRELLPLVKPGGCFLNVEVTASGGPMTAAASRRSRLVERQRRLREETGEERSLESLQEEMTRRRAATDHGVGAGAEEAMEPPTVEEQLRWIREAGFDETDCLWRDGYQALYAAYRHPR